MTTDPTMRVLLVDDHEIIREGLRRAFEREDGVEIAGEAAGVAEAAAVAGSRPIDVAVVDIRLPDGNGIDLVRQLRAGHPDLGIVVLTMYAGDDQLFAALDAGASAFVPKSAPADEIVAAARHAATAPHAFAAADLSAAMRRRLEPDGPRLSPRETEVLNLLAEGLGIGQIARRLYIAESTAKTHVSHVYDKLGAANRAQALMTALRLGLLTADADPA